VKSRFQLRYIHLFPAENYGEFLRVIRSVLSVPQDLTASPYAKDFNASLDELFEDQTSQKMTRRVFDLSKDFRLIFRCLVSTSRPNPSPAVPNTLAAAL